MPYVFDCNEWRLIQAIGLGISRRKSRLDGAIVSRESSTSCRVHPDTELLEVELRRAFLQKDCPQRLSASQFEQLDVGVKSLCDLLDRLVHPQVCQETDALEYPRLRALAKHLDTSDQIIDLACGPHSTLFKPPENKAELKRNLVAVTEYNDSLARLFTPLSELAPPRMVKGGGGGKWKDARIRDRASVVLGSLFEHFKCGTSHEVMLKLSDHTKHETASPSLDVMLPLCPDSNQWHEVKCCADHSSGSTTFPTPVRDICEDLRQYAGRGRGLMLLIKEYELFRAWSPFPQPNISAVSTKKTLNELIDAGSFKPLDLAALTSGSSTTRYSTREKRTLAVRLGHCLLDFFDADLGSKRIHLLGTATSSLRNWPLYVSFASALPGKIEAYTFRVGNPTLLSFAKLLLEIHVGQSIPLSVGAQCDVTNRATWAELCYYVDQLVHERDDTYLQAVRACLMVHVQISEALRLDDTDRVSDQLTVREELYREVVSKLERGLAESIPRAYHKRRRSESPERPLKRTYNPDLGRGKDVNSIDSSYTLHSALSRQFSVVPYSCEPDSPVPETRRKPEVQGATKTPRDLSQMSLVPGASGFFDDSTRASYPSNLCEYADNFMRAHRLVYDKVIQPTETIPRMKVAVLDTGADLGHPAVQARRERIKDVKTWLPPEIPQEERDLSGHGTHVTCLLLDIAPDCDVYVAKIAEHQPTSPSQIAKAVTHATTYWNVDIIIMSFGFQDESPPGCDDLREAIHRAHASRVLMFAAASNTGAHGAAPAFPARLSNVFCIYSGDGMGNCASTNPTARRRAHNFLTLGEAVESAWPRALAQYPWTKRRSGTSFATPIAAGIAAFLMLYAYQNLSRGKAERFKEYDKMREWLFHVSNERAGYNVVSVGNFFSRSAEERRVLLASFLDGKPWKI